MVCTGFQWCSAYFGHIEVGLSLGFKERIRFMARWLLQGPPVSFWVACFER